jgi:uncharacterized membrane protein (UPF0136 family)
MRTQAGVVAGMALGFVAAVAALLWPAPAMKADRLSLWLACAMLASLWLALAVALLARHRFLSAQDIDGAGPGEASGRAKLLQALIQNTLEQTVLAVTAWGAWLFVTPRGPAGTVIICAGLFSLGRLLFFAGYARGAAARSLGFTLTFYPSVALLLLTAPRAMALMLQNAAKLTP